MREYKFVTGNTGHCQKVLNQWKHQYLIEIISVWHTPDFLSTAILLIRSDIDKVIGGENYE